MDNVFNPFQPGAGLRPPELTGRDAEIEGFDYLVARAKKRFVDRGMMLHGLRGVGKTVLLRQLQNQADRAGWLTVSLEGSLGSTAQQQTRMKLGRDLAVATRTLAGNKKNPVFAQARRSISSLSLKLGFLGAELVLKPDSQAVDTSTGLLEIDFPDAILQLAEAVRSQMSPAAVGIFVDEIQDLDDELLEIFLATQHEAGQRDLPFYVIGAGLPSVPTRLGEVKTYAERLFNYREIGPLTVEDTRRAFEQPFSHRGSTFEEGALDYLVEASQGYPYFIQQFGFATWSVSESQWISLDDAQAGVEVGKSELDSGFYRTRWDRVTESEQEYLIALALVLDGAQARSGDVATKMNKTTGQVSSTRQTLVEKGLIFSPAYGKLAFTVPGMREFVLRQDR